MPKQWTDYTDCPKCSGSGWVQWHKLDEYDGPAIQCGRDDTNYTCDHSSHLIEVKQYKSRIARPIKAQVR